MSFVTKAQALALKRPTQPLQLPEFDAPLLVAEMSGLAALRLRDAGPGLEERLVIMAADMLVNEDGSRMLAAADVENFLGRLSVDSATALLKACTIMRPPSGGGDPGNSQPGVRP
jgi:hypothetical protein